MIYPISIQPTQIFFLQRIEQFENSFSHAEKYCITKFILSHHIYY